MPEVLEKRTRSSKTHSLGGRKFAWDGTIGSIHYKDAQDAWQNIDNEFLPVAAPWDWEMVKADYHIRVKEDFTAGQIIEFEVQGETVQFQPMALEYTNDLDQIQQISMPQNVTPVITNPVVDLLPAVGVQSHQGTIRWPDAYGQGIDFEWHCQSTRLAKRLEIANLNNLPVPQQYILDGGNPVLRLNLIFDPPSKQDVDIVVDGQVWNQQSDVQTFKTIEFVKDGEVLWGFMPLRYWDSADNQGQSVATLEKRGNKLYISIRVPYGWLQTATFPVFIDTDVEEIVSASYDDCLIYRGSIDLTTGSVQFGAYGGGDSGWDDMHSGARFITVAIDKDQEIDVAHITLRCSSSESTADCRINLGGEAIGNAATFSTFANFTGRDRTTLVPWTDIGAWTQDSDYESPSIVTPVQEIINHVDWVSGNALVIFLQDNATPTSYNTRQGYSWDGDTVYCPKLHIEYSAGGVNYPISLSPGLTASATVAYLAAWDRTVAPGLTASATVAYLVAYKRATTSDLTTAVTVLKGWGRKITTSPGITVNAVISRTVAYKRATSPGLTAAVTILKGWGRKITTTADLAISATVLKGWGRKIATSTGLTVSVTVVKSWGRTITTSADLTISATVSKLIAYKKSVSAGLTTAVSIVETFSAGAAHYLITLTTNLSVSSTVVRTLAYKRATQSALSVAVSLIKSWGRAITTSPGLTISATILKSRGWKITTSAGLTISATISRVLTYTRAIVSGLTASTTITATLSGVTNYLITIVTNLTVSASIALTLNRILKIFSTIATALKITSTKTQPLTITSSLASPLTITSTFEVH